MLRGEGSLFVVTRRGVTAAGVQAKPLRAPSQAFRARHRAVAWSAAWLKLRGAELLGPRELVGNNRWSTELLYHDSQGYKQADHHPDFVAMVEDGHICIEVGVPATPTKRLEVIMQQHEGWRWMGQSRGVIYICENQRASERVTRIGGQAGLLPTPGGGLRIEMLERSEPGPLTQARDSGPNEMAGPERTSASLHSPASAGPFRRRRPVWRRAVSGGETTIGFWRVKAQREPR